MLVLLNINRRMGEIDTWLGSTSITARKLIGRLTVVCASSQTDPSIAYPTGLLCIVCGRWKNIFLLHPIARPPACQGRMTVAVHVKNISEEDPSSAVGEDSTSANSFKVQTLNTESEDSTSRLK